MNVAMIQPRNGYNHYYFALDSTFFEAKLTRPRLSRGQMLEARGRGRNFGLALTSLDGSPYVRTMPFLLGGPCNNFVVKDTAVGFSTVL